MNNLEKTLTGIIDITSRGTGYVPLPGFTEDIEIPKDSVGVALHGDEVEIILLPKKEGRRRAGKVRKVLARARTEFIGLIAKEKGRFILIPDEKRVGQNFLISAPSSDLKEGWKATGTLQAWDDPKKEPTISITRLIGKAGEHETEIEAIVLQNRFDMHFPLQVEKEAEHIGKHRTIPGSEIERRRDLRAVSTFTIDPDDAKDFDDALSFRKLPDGNFEIGVHIADVTHYVISGGAIDKEAQKRATSVYLVDRTIPMLPEVLSNDVCSLNPEEDKLTYSAIFVMNPEAKLKERWFGRTIIRSDKRFTYKTAQESIDTGEGLFAKELQTLNTLSKKLRAKRLQDGSINFEQDEVKFELDAKGNPIRAYVKELLDTNLLIEDFMLLANRSVAEHIHELCKGRDDHIFIYRIHDRPDPDKIEELSVFLRAIGYDLKHSKGEVSSKEINRVLKEIKGTAEEKLIQVATIRSMAKAVYTTKNIGHFSLSFRHYTHFTSPIRRYPDMMAHRLLTKYTGEGEIPDKELKEYQRLAIESSRREIEAVKAERESVKYMQVKYMMNHVGKEFEGTISGVADFGIFVEEKTTKAEGLVRIGDLPGYFLEDEGKFSLVDKHKGIRYRLGDTIKMKLISADPELRQINWKLVEREK